VFKSSDPLKAARLRDRIDEECDPLKAATLRDRTFFQDKFA